VESPDSFIPKQQHHTIYMKHFAIFERLITKLSGEFESIAELQQDS